MSIQMTLVFVLLSVEMGVISFLLLPLPPKLQGYLLKLYNLASHNSNITIIVGFVDALLGIMFVDSFKNGFGLLSSHNRGDEIIEYGINKDVWDLRAKMFYSQRNLYILGAVLSLQVCIWFMTFLLRSTVKNKGKLVELSKEGTIASKKASSSDGLVDDEKTSTETKELQQQVSKLELDVETLNKQYDSLFAQYEKKNAAPTESASEKKDN